MFVDSKILLWTVSILTHLTALDKFFMSRSEEVRRRKLYRLFIRKVIDHVHAGIEIPINNIKAFNVLEHKHWCL